MPNCETENMEKTVRDEVLRILRERVKNPILGWDTVRLEPWNPQGIASIQLTRAGYFTQRRSYYLGRYGLLPEGNSTFQDLVAQ